MVRTCLEIIEENSKNEQFELNKTIRKFAYVPTLVHDLSGTSRREYDDFVIIWMQYYYYNGIDGTKWI